MATADTRRDSRRRAALASAALVIAAAALFAVTYDRSKSTATESSASSHATAPLCSTVAITSDTRHKFTKLAALLDASDLVVQGRVVAAEAGRVFGNGDASAIRSHVLTLRVRSVLAGSRPAGPDTVVLVEEEAALTDGTPVSIDGMRPSRVDDDGIWFLVASGDPDFPGYAVVNSQGRYLNAVGGALEGGDTTDDLVGELAALGRTRLAAAVASDSHR